MKNRTISWMEGKVLEIITKNGVIKSYLALSYLVLKNVRSIAEQGNLDIAVQNLISQKVIICNKDTEGMNVYCLRK